MSTNSDSCTGRRVRIIIYLLKSYILKIKGHTVPMYRLWDCESISIFAGVIEYEKLFHLTQVVKDLNYEASLTHTHARASYSNKSGLLIKVTAATGYLAVGFVHV